MQPEQLSQSSRILATAGSIGLKIFLITLHTGLYICYALQFALDTLAKCFKAVIDQLTNEQPDLKDTESESTDARSRTDQIHQPRPISTSE